jgi:hypothetical protein
MSSNAEKQHLIEVGVIVVEGKLDISVSYNSLVFNDATIQRFITKYKTRLLEII